jgi:hypothetical protein
LSLSAAAAALVACNAAAVIGSAGLTSKAMLVAGKQFVHQLQPLRRNL